jgi:hypothetical protein
LSRLRANAASLASTWPLWMVLLIATVGAGGGILMGWIHPTTPETTTMGHAEKNLATPGGAQGADVTMANAHRRAFNHVRGKPSPVPDCPTFDNITSEFTTTLSADTSLVIASTLHVTVTGITPQYPLLHDNLQRPEGTREFASCFIATYSDIKQITWGDGKLDVDIDLLWDDTNGYTNQLVRPRFGFSDSTLTVDLCAHPEWVKGVRTICQIGAKNTVVVRVKQPLGSFESIPFPGKQQTKDDYVESTWQFEGPMPPLRVELDVPATVVATSWLHWDRSRNYHLPFSGSAATVDLFYVADASAMWIALIVAAILVWRGVGSGRWWGPAVRLSLVAIAGVLLAIQIQKFGRLNAPYLANGVIVVLAWGILSAAVARSMRALLVIVGLSLAALVLLVTLAVWPGAYFIGSPLMVAFCALLICLVLTAGWVLWDQLVTLFVLGYLNDETAIWRVRYHNAVYGVYCLIAAAFMFGVGFPVGETLRAGRGQGRIWEMSADLIWSTGISFRYPLTWVSLLIAISFLAEYLLNLPNGKVGRAVAWVLALIVSLSAPWTSRFAIGTWIPVWVLQFCILGIAFRLLSSGAGQRPLRQLRNTRLLQAATVAPQKKAAALTPEEPEAVAKPSKTPLPEVDPSAGSRLLILGSERGRLPNAKAAAQIASVIAIIPVAYLVWTTVATLGGLLSNNTGILVVALLAILEFARWVVSGFVFGYLYSNLPGRIGPVKALAFAAIWIVSCIGPLVVAHGAGIDLTKETIYRSAQFALFAIVLAVLIDLKTVKSAGGTWRALQQVYDLQNYGEVAAAVAPAALLAVALAQQIAAGSGLDVANTFLSGITPVLQGHP